MAVAYESASSFLVRHVDQQCAAADMAAEAYHQLGVALVGYLRANLRCNEEAQDLAQEVYIRIARYPNVSDVQNFRAFVFTIAKNLLRDKSRRCATKLKASSISVDDVALLAVDGDPVAQLEAEERIQQMEFVISKLRPACRKAFMLSRTDGMKYSDIAEQMKVSVSMVEKYVCSVVNALKADECTL